MAVEDPVNYDNTDKNGNRNGRPEAGENEGGDKKNDKPAVWNTRKQLESSSLSASISPSVEKPKPKIQFPYEYNPEIRRKAKLYTRSKLVAGILNGLFMPIVFLALFVITGFSSGIRDFAAGVTDNYYGQVAIYGMVFFTILTVIGLPTSFYVEYIYERRYGVSNQTAASWFADFFKSLILLYVFSVPILLLFYFLLANFAYWWAIAGIGMLILSIIATAVVPAVALPLFYRVEPLKDEEQKKRFRQLAEEAGIGNVDTILVVHESAKSKKANAAFAGLGRTKRILLFDTLLENFTKEEVEAAVAHELGHYAHKDIIKGLALDGITVFPILFLVDAILKLSVGHFGIMSVSDVANLPIVLLSGSLISLATMPLSNAISRRFEMGADTFSLDVTRKPMVEISLEKRLADIDLEDTAPSPIVELIFYSHPSVQRRIENAERWAREHNIPLQPPQSPQPPSSQPPSSQPPPPDDKTDTGGKDRSGRPAPS